MSPPGAKADQLARTSSTRKSSAKNGLPSRSDILDFIGDSEGKVGKREIARAFGIKGPDRIALKRLLKEMAEDGLIAGARKSYRQPGKLPPVTVLEVVERDSDGEFIAVPAKWDMDVDGPRPRLLVVADGQRSGDVAGVGDRILARIKAVPKDEQDGYAFEARPIKRLKRAERSLLGIFRAHGQRGVIDPVDRRQLREWRVEAGDEGEAQDGDLVRFRISSGGRYGLQHATVIERLGNPDDQRQVSLIAIHAHGIPEDFPERALAELDALPELDIEKREDLRELPLVTIDPVDARDHDDAVWAAPDEDPKNIDGWVVIVAIADVAHYVRANSALDRAALERGNSVYFPDRVVPMLPERISNDLCSLREGEERPCLAVRMVFGADGKKRKHKFMRAVMRSHAKLAYVGAQAAIDGAPDKETAPLIDTVLRPLWDAYEALKKARNERAPLDLDLPERKIVMDGEGRIRDIVTPERLTAHRLIEEFMIQANVAAAETLEAKGSALIYRVHDAPSKEKLVALRDFLKTLDISIPKSGVLRPEHFNGVLARVRGSDINQLVSEVVLRAQSQAEYSAQNLGHFGLNLRRYAHFTSPIRRYADLVVHRALIAALGFGPGGLRDDNRDELEQVAATISDTERRAMAAERETTDRLITSYLADRIGAKFHARVSGVTRSGLFVKLDETGADGFVPAATIGEDYFRYDETHHMLVGDDTNQSYRLGDRVEVRLVEAIPSAGALRFEMLSNGRKRSARKAQMRPKRRTRSVRRRG